MAVCTSAFLEQAGDHLAMLQATAQLNEQGRLRGCEDGGVDCDVGSHVVAEPVSGQPVEELEHLLKSSSDTTEVAALSDEKEGEIDEKEGEDDVEAGRRRRRPSAATSAATKKCTWIGASAGTDAWCNSNCNHNPANCPAASCCCETMSPTVSGRSPGSDVGGKITNVGNLAACQDMCLDEDACLAMSYKASASSCFMFDRTYEGNFDASVGSDDCVVGNKALCTAATEETPATPAPTPEAPPACGCSPSQKCYAVGDPHYLATFGAGKFDFMGKGLFQIAANKEGSFKAQAVQCAANNGHEGAAVFKAFAFFINGDIITIIGGDVRINGEDANPQAGGYTLSGALDTDAGITLATGECQSCQSSVNIRQLKVGKTEWDRLDLNLDLADASSDYGICAGAKKTSQPGCNERLFTDEQLQQILSDPNCAVEVPDCQNLTPVPPPTPTSEVCANAGADYAVALQKCTDGLDTTDDVVIQACVLDYCTTGDEETINEFKSLEPTPPPPAECNWVQYLGDNSKCGSMGNGASADGFASDEAGCRKAAEGVGHKFYQFTNEMKGIGGYCSTQPDCDTPKTGTSYDWKIFKCEDCTDGACTIAEDPHINVFDGRQISLLQGQSHFDSSSTQAMQTEMLQRSVADGEEGDMWLVKSPSVSIQARYARDDTLAEENLFVKSLAVSGDFMKGNATRGNKLVVGDLEQGVTFNGLPILVAEQSDFQHNAIIKAKRHLDSSLVQNPETVNPGIDVELPEGVKLLINRQNHYINVQVTMPPSKGGQDGLCGNFNGDGDDDSLELIEARDPRVAAGESLF